MFPAKGGKLFHKFLFPGTGKFISVPVSADVPLFHAGEKPVKLPVKIFPVSVPQGKPHSEADNAFHPGLGAVVKDAGKVFPCVVDKGQERAEPYHCGDSLFPENFQGFKPLPGGAHIRLQFPAQPFIKGGEGHLHHGFGAAVDFFEKIQIPQHQGGFCNHRKAETVAVNQLKGFPGEQEFFFQRHIGVAHGAGSYHALFTLPFEGVFQKFKGVFFYSHIFKPVVNVVTVAPGIAVNAAVGAAPVQVHSVLRGKNAFCLNIMHGLTSVKG